MSDLRRTTRELEAEIPVPDFDALVDITRRRRQRRRSAALTGAAAVVATVAVLTTSTGHREATPPTDRNSTTTAVTSVGFLTVDEVVGNQASTLVRTLRSSDGAGAVATVWTRCRTLVPSFGSTDCELAIEVTQGDRRSRHMWGLAGYESYDALPGGAFFLDLGREGAAPVLLRAESAAPIELRDLRASTLLPARTGTDVVPCGHGELCVVDVANLRLLGMDVPIVQWAPTQDTTLWGMTSAEDNRGIVTYTAVWVDRQGKPRSRALTSAEGSELVAADTQEAGVMTFYELPPSYDVDGPLPNGVVLHGSSDGGASWQLRRVPQEAREAVRLRVLPGDWRAWAAVR
jgi:hypothetical protein